MVKFQIMSDIHIENYSDDVKIEEFIKPSADILILAGDIGRVNKTNQFENFIKNLCKEFKVVLYVLGNHEFYKVDGCEDKTMNTVLSEIEKFSSQIPNLYILNRKSILIDDVCITGCTLWSQAVFVPKYIVKIPQFNTYQYNEHFKKDLAYIEKMIKYCESKNYKHLVVTHHSPTFKVFNTKKRTKFDTLYYSNLDYLLHSKKVHTWVFGHVHMNFDFHTHNGTRLVSNQKGKPKDKITDFMLDKVITI
jgi:predicted phosphodiesterase